MEKALHKLREQLSGANIFVSTSVQGPAWTGRKGLLLFMVRSGSLLSSGGLAIWFRAVLSVPLLLGRESKRNSLRVLDVQYIPGEVSPCRNGSAAHSQDFL